MGDGGLIVPFEWGNALFAAMLGDYAPARRLSAIEAIRQQPFF